MSIIEIFQFAFNPCVSPSNKKLSMNLSCYNISNRNRKKPLRRVSLINYSAGIQTLLDFILLFSRVAQMFQQLCSSICATVALECCLFRCGSFGSCLKCPISHKDKYFNFDPIIDKLNKIDITRYFK